MAKIRLDTLVCRQGRFDSREKARAVIMSGSVFIGGKRMDKPGTMVPEAAEAEIRGNAIPYVSRGGLKLEKALREFDISPKGRICIDCGASTGGFTDCLLLGGAERVYAVDVGYGQLDWKLRNDPRVVTMERTNVRYLTPADIPDSPSLAAVDVSFISLKHILPAVKAVLASSGEAVCLIKPQFEAGREQVGKKGVVREPGVHIEVLNKFLKNAGESGFFVRSLSFSPIKGPEGNIEYLGHLTLADSCSAPTDPAAVVEAARSAL